MIEHTDAYKNFEANLIPLTALFKLLKAGIKRSGDSLLKSVDRHSKIPEAVDSFIQTRRLAYNWIPVMLVTFTEAFLKDGLSDLARRNPELRAELRQQWAGGRKKGGAGKRVKFLQRKGGPQMYKGHCLFFVQNLWDVRNLIVHAQGRADHDYVKKYPNPPMKVGDSIYPGIPSLKKWIEAVIEFVESTEQFFLRYAADKKAAHSRP